MCHFKDLARFGVKNIPRWLKVCTEQEHDEVFSWVCVPVHVSVCCFCLHAFVGAEQIHVIWMIDILPLAESWSQRPMEMRFQFHPFFYFCPVLESSRLLHILRMTPAHANDEFFLDGSIWKVKCHFSYSFPIPHGFLSLVRLKSKFEKLRHGHVLLE